jgi:methionyl-tRNA formyltransferase
LDLNPKQFKGRYVFAGSPDFAVPTLSALLDNHETQCVGVFTQPEKPTGRGKRVSPTAVQAYVQSRSASVPLFHPTTPEAFADAIHQLKPDVIIVVAYGMIIPKRIVDAYCCINVHPSLLPKYRGATPIQAALLNQDTVSGVSLIRMNEYMDAGDTLLTQSMPIPVASTAGDLHAIYAGVGAELCLRYLYNLTSITPTAQDDTLATYDAAEKLARIQAFSPKPGAYILQNNKRIKILRAQVLDGCLEPLEIQVEGKPRMTYSNYLAGNPPIVI